MDLQSACSPPKETCKSIVVNAHELEDDGTSTDFDLDQVVRGILNWEVIITQLEQEKQDVVRENTTLKSQVELLETNCEENLQNLTSLQETVKSLQVLVQSRSDQADEIKSLREQLILHQDRAVKMEQKLEEEIKNNQKRTKENNEKHETELKNLQQTLEKAFAGKEGKLHDVNNELRSKLMEEAQKRGEYEKTHEDEILKLQMEYQSKITFMQAQNNRLQTTSNPNLVGNEIFRKKLQHVQEESTKEINRLKEELRLLRQQSNDFFNQNTGSFSPHTSFRDRRVNLKRKHL
ncbi:unnamed protein product [Clavelina lepadiformis]|uniref:Uncharacterized protein n=1 Tax=Clavelina lepadiformis TaxID=159417 RepID=A0ABP0GBX1_CLALP